MLRRAGLVGALVPSLAVAACAPGPRPERVRQRCDCAFLTDYDDQATQVVEVCAPVAAAADVARACAVRAAPGHVERCACAPVVPSAACSVDTCGPDP